MRLGHSFWLITSAGMTERGGTTSQVIVNEPRTAKHEAFPLPQGVRCSLHLSNRFKQHINWLTEHVTLDIPNMFVSRASITVTNVHHLALGPEYWSEQDSK